jgi:glycopeptide antibiotics resistance protein
MRQEFDLPAMLSGLALGVIPLLFLRRRGVWFMLFFCVFWFYLLVLVSVTIYPIPLLYDAQFIGQPGRLLAQMLRFGNINLVPFYFNNCWNLPNLCAQGIWENVLMTIPFGFGFKFLFRVSFTKCLWLAFVPGLLIETAQLLAGLWLGIPYRTVDINDIIFNSLGVWLGLAAFWAFSWLALAASRKLGLKPHGLWGYLLKMIG